MNRYLLRRVLAIAAIVLIIVGLLTFVLAKVLGWSSISTGIGMLMSWGPSVLIALAFLVRAIFPRRRQHQEGLTGAGEPINDLYLGRVASPPVVRSSDEYSAFPPPNGTGR